ncbi:hypothetical protein FKP32DRAFT_1674306 [Trametes sanguinea]|nr:hypothetical protein FKP32DRAFT_1674306 [Trametes sanguinea]
MPYHSRPVSLGALDRFDNGTGLLSFPLEYHELFRVAHNLSYNLPARRLNGPDGTGFVLADPFSVQLITRLGVDLLLRIGAASYGGILPPRQPLGWDFLRPGALEELGLMESALRDLYANFQGQLPFEAPLAPADFQMWVDTLYGVIADTRDWISVAQRRSSLLGGRTGWNWAYCQAPVTDFQVGLHLQWPATRDNDGIVQMGAANSAAVVPHPIVGPGAANALIPYSPRTSLNRPVSTSTALIPHPIYGPGAQNALVRYQPSGTTWTNAPSAKAQATRMDSYTLASAYNVHNHSNYATYIVKPPITNPPPLRGARKVAKGTQGTRAIPDIPSYVGLLQDRW